MAKMQIALVLSGGVSLGSYIAGALDEVLLALRTGNGDYEIDLITGASAGATTGAILAHALLYHKGVSKLHKVWVEDVDMSHLLSTDQEEPFSLLNPRRLREVARETLDLKGVQPEPATFCANRLTVAFTLANTIPLPYKSRVSQPVGDNITADFVQYRHSEQETFFLRKNPPAGNPTNAVETWERLSKVAQASAAIPGVFPRIALERDSEDPQQYIQEVLFDGTRTFWYYDGGTFNNLPVDLAWHYHKEVYGDDISKRKVVIVNPYLPKPKSISREQVYPSILAQTLGVVGAMHRESRTLQFQNDMADVSRRKIELENPTAEGSRLLPGINLPPVELLRNFALVMPQKDDLRGYYLHAMGAFLDKRLREYDFRRGASDARRIITSKDGLGITEYQQNTESNYYTPENDKELNIDISEYTALAKLTSLIDPSRKVKQVFEDGLRERFDYLLDRWDLVKGISFREYLVDKALSALFRQHLMPKYLPGMWKERSDT
jgi:predicted acylesterase/phospholipase RssA